MKNVMKRELLNDVVTGLMIAAMFASVVPVDALAQSLTNVADTSNQNVLNPIVKIATYISYGMGAVLTIAGIAGAKKHADNPGNNPLGPALGKLGAGAAFLVAPYLMGVVQGTGSTSLGTTGVTSIGAASF